MPAVSNPPSHHDADYSILNSWANRTGTTIRRHVPYTAGQLVMVNWALVDGTDSILYEAESAPISHPTNFITINNRKQIHLFKGKESLIVLEAANDFAAEVKVAWDDKIGYINAYVLLPIEEEDVDRLGSKRRASTKKTADRALGDIHSSESSVGRNRQHGRARSR